MPEGLLSPVHLIILFAILILLFGAKRIPELGKGIGSGIREFRGGIAGLSEGQKDEQLPAAGETAAPQNDAPPTTTD